MFIQTEATDDDATVKFFPGVAILDQGSMVFDDLASAAVSPLASALYIPVYLYKAMRRVYGQRHLATVPKFFGMVIAYSTGLLLIFGVTGVLAAFSL